MTIGGWNLSADAYQTLAASFSNMALDFSSNTSKVIMEWRHFRTPTYTFEAQKNISVKFVWQSVVIIQKNFAQIFYSNGYTVDFGYKEHLGPGESVPYNRLFPISEVHTN